jgi:hypothetical protein
MGLVYGVFADLDQAGGDLDWYSFSITEGAVVVLETHPIGPLVGNGVDTDMTLFDSNTNVLGEGLDNGAGYFSKIGPIYLDAGDYDVLVTGWNSTVVGEYEFRISVVAPNCNIGAATCNGDTLSSCNGLEFAEASNPCILGCTDPGNEDAYCNLPTSALDVPGTVNDTLSTSGEIAWYTITMTDTQIVELNVADNNMSGLDPEIFLCSVEQFSVS